MSAGDNLQDLLEQIDGTANPNDYQRHTALKLLRASKVRRSDIVVKHGLVLLEKGALPDSEKWTVCEQVLIAALDIGQSKIATDCLAKLTSKFPESMRMQRSRGMVLESEGRLDEAIALYDGLLAKQPSNLLILKRKVCVFKSQGAIPQAIEQLNSILQLNSADVATWQELAELYISEGDFEAAAFCVEEIVLLMPTSAHAHCRLAEIYYTIGNKVCFLKARKHYSTSLHFQAAKSGNSRALYGLILVCRALKLPECLKSSDDEYAISDSMLQWALACLKDLSSEIIGVGGADSIVSVALNKVFG